MTTHVPVTSDGDLACGCTSFVAMASSRDLCARCTGRIDDLLAVAIRLAALPGADQAVAGDRAAARTLKWLRSMTVKADAAHAAEAVEEIR